MPTDAQDIKILHMFYVILEKDKGPRTSTIKINRFLGKWMNILTGKIMSLGRVS